MNGKTKYVIGLLVVILATCVGGIIYFAYVNDQVAAEQQLKAIRKNQDTIQQMLRAVQGNSNYLSDLQRQALKNHDIMLQQTAVIQELQAKATRLEAELTRHVISQEPTKPKEVGKQ